MKKTRCRSCGIVKTVITPDDICEKCQNMLKLKKLRSQKRNPFTGREPKSCPYCIDSEGFRELFVEGICPICGYDGEL